MVSEKMSAAMEIQHAVAVAAMTGNAGLIPARTIAIYELIDSANVDAEEIARRAYGGWYLSAEEALSRGLVAGLV